MTSPHWAAMHHILDTIGVSFITFKAQLMRIEAERCLWQLALLMLECSTFRKVPYVLLDLHKTTAMDTKLHLLACIVTATHIHHASDVSVHGCW